jgi:MYXO-CTERM domain-containing protein
MKTTNVIVGTAFSLVLAGAAHANPYTGISIDSLGDMGYGETYQMYIDVDAGARVDAIFGNSLGALSIDTAAGMSFYQNALGGPTSTAINSAFFPLAPSLEWDSYVTIGALHSDGNPFGNNALLDIGIDWSSFNAGGSLETSNGSWFVTPADAQGGEVGGRVLIGQFTVVGGTGDGYADLVGQLSIQGKDAAGETFQELGATWAVVPAPGAIALLGLAGVCSRRRRK